MKRLSVWAIIALAFALLLPTSVSAKPDTWQSVTFVQGTIRFYQGAGVYRVEGAARGVVRVFDLADPETPIIPWGACEQIIITITHIKCIGPYHTFGPGTRLFYDQRTQSTLVMSDQRWLVTANPEI